MTRHTIVIVLLALFLLSVAVRLPTLNRPLSKHHEFCTAVALRVIQIWDADGIKRYHYSPVMNYPNAADKFINNYASGSGKMLDDAGNYYYISHPPFAYYVPYFLFRLSGIKPDVLPLQIFNLLLHGISALGGYLAVRFVFSDETESKKNTRALAGFLFYLFSPVTLWFQSNTYMSDMAVQPLFIFGVYAVLLFFKQEKIKTGAFLTALVFLMNYTTWFGMFFSFSLLMTALFRREKMQRPVLFFFTVAVATIAAHALTAFQYSNIAGAEAFVAEMTNRFSERSSHDMTFVWTILKNYLTGFLPLLAVIFLFTFRGKPERTENTLLFFSLSAPPVLLLHLILPNYSGHDYTAMYAALALSATGASATFFSSEKRKRMIAVFAAYVLLSVAQYYYINRPGEYSITGERYAAQRDRGLFIAANASTDETVFLLNEKPSPELVLYAGRNIQRADNEKAALDFLQKHHRQRGILIYETEGRMQFRRLTSGAQDIENVKGNNFLSGFYMKHNLSPYWQSSLKN